MSGTSSRRSVTSILSLLLFVVASPLSAQTSVAAPHRDCRYDHERGTAELRSERRRVFLPDTDVFTPPLADVKEPRFSFSYRRVRFFGSPLVSGGMQETIDAGLVSAGGAFGLLGRRPIDNCDGFQVSLIGAVFSQFNFDAPSTELLNTDFVVGTQVTARQGRVSGRVRLYHQSSHLGDEFLLYNPSFDSTDFGFQAIDALVSFDGEWWRVYTGGGSIFFNDAQSKRGLLQSGIELHARDAGARRFGPLAGIDVNSLQARGWRATTNAAGGLEWAGPNGTRRMRVLVVFLHGFIPFGQFFNEQRLRNVGLQLQLEF